MRKTCAKAVDGLRNIQEREHYLYSTTDYHPAGIVGNPQAIPTTTHTLSHHFSTHKYDLFNLLITYFSTFYTGLITNTTKYMYIKITY